MPSHREIDDRSLMLHACVADKLRADPALMTRAQATLKRWRSHASPRTFIYLDEWNNWLNLELEHCLRHALDPGEYATAMRQCSPLACLLSNSERFALLKMWRANHPHTPFKDVPRDAAK
jgi:hypothetical protein